MPLGLARANEQRAVRDAGVRPGGKAHGPFTSSDNLQDARHVAGVEATLRAGVENGHAHDAPGDGDVGGGEASGIERHEALAVPPLEGAIGARGHLREVGVLVREDVARGRHALEEPRVALPGERNDLVTNEVAQIAGVGVRRVLAPDDAAHAQKIAELLVGAPEKRANDAVAAPRDGGEALRARALYRMHEERLGTVVRRVRRENASARARQAGGRAQLVGELVRRGVAHLTGHVLDVRVT